MRRSTQNLHIGGAVEPFFAPGVTLAQLRTVAAHAGLVARIGLASRPR